jgi:tight adherence protein C
MDLDLLLDFSANGLLQRHFVTVTLALVFVAAVLVVLGGWTLVTDRTSYKKRLIASRQSSGGSEPVSLRFNDNGIRWLQYFAPLYKSFLPKDITFISAARRKLIQAGFMQPSAVTTFYAVKTVSAAAFGLGVLLLVPLVIRDIPPVNLLPIAVVALVVGYLLPAWLVDARTAKRKRLIREGFPDGLDLLLICVEAGLGLDAAIARVGAELERAHPILAQQFRLVGTELRAGRSREEALRGLRERTGVDDVGSLVTLLVQSDELGTSIGQALRVHAFEMRAKRLLKAEEKAHKIPVKLAFPLMFGLIPVIFMVTLTPAVIKFITFIAPILAGGMGGGQSVAR